MCRLQNLSLAVVRVVVVAGAVAAAAAVVVADAAVVIAVVATIVVDLLQLGVHCQSHLACFTLAVSLRTARTATHH
jgi:hypothetical protein